MEEEWKDIIIEKNNVTYDYTGLYQVSNLGRVRSLKYISNGEPKIILLRKHKNGYYNVRLQHNNKSSVFSIHRLVATMFIPNPDNLPAVNHKDEDKSNNCVSNLEWCTHKYNSNYGTRIERHKKAMQSKTKEEYDNMRRKMSENHADISGGKHPKARKVVCVETGQVFGSITEAQKWCHGGVESCCKHNQKYAGRHPETGEKLSWMYYEEWLEKQYEII